MRTEAIIGLGLAVALAACERSGPRPPTPARNAGAVNPEARVQTYRCADGTSVEAGYPDAQTAVVTVGGHAYTLKAALAASGVRYVGLGLQWWTKGMSEAWLSHLEPGEDIASEAGVECHAGAASAEPPAPVAFHRKATVTLRRVDDVPGATPEQLRWRIARIEPAE